MNFRAVSNFYKKRLQAGSEIAVSTAAQELHSRGVCVIAHGPRAMDLHRPGHSETPGAGLEGHGHLWGKARSLPRSSSLGNGASEPLERDVGRGRITDTSYSRPHARGPRGRTRAANVVNFLSM